MEIKIIGRSPECDFFYEDPFISRQHLQFVKYSDFDYRIIDIDSTTGTYVNGQKIPPGTEYKLEKSDVVKIGNTLLKWNEFFKTPSKTVSQPDIYATKPDEEVLNKNSGNLEPTLPNELFEMVKAFAEDGVYTEKEQIALKSYCQTHNIDYEKYIEPLINEAIFNVNKNKKEQELKNQNDSQNNKTIHNYTVDTMGDLVFKPLYATFGQRLGAFLIDAIILSVLEVLISFVYVSLNGMYDYEDLLILNVLYIVISWFYFAILESSKAGATFGKQAVGLFVVNENNNRISFFQASGRFFARILSVLILFIGYLMPLWTEKKQALHDLISGCIVVKK